MLRTVKSLFGHSINDGADYRAVLLNPNDMPSAKPVFVEQAQADSQDAGTYTVDVQALVLSVRVLDYGSRVALALQLKGWCKRGTSGSLVVTYSDDGLDYARSCRVVSVVQDPDHPLWWTVTLQSGDTAWKAVVPETDTWNATSTGGTKSIDVAGDDETYLSFNATPSAAPSGRYLYQNLYRLAGVDGQTYGVWPHCIQLDTAALVSAGKMRADCFDLRITLGATETRRWIDSPNTNHTKVWFVPDQKVGVGLALNKAVANPETITYLQFKTDAATVAKLKKLPKAGLVYHGTEWIAFNDNQATAGKLIVAQRGALNTTLQAHSVGDTFLFIPVDVHMLYGNSSATDPSLDDPNYDDTKPLFDLNLSTNTAWSWSATSLFYDADHPNRPGGWAQYIKRLGDVSKLYTTAQDAGSSAAMGMEVGTWLKGTVPQNENAVLAWVFHAPIGIDTVTATGQKWRNTARWPSTTGCQRSSTGTKWSSLWNDVIPASVNTWTALATHSAVSVGGYKWLQFVLSGSFAALATALALYEIDTLTVAFLSASVPTGAFLGEQSNYALEVALENLDTGDAVSLVTPMRLSQALEVDGEAFTVHYNGLNAHSALTLADPSRPYFIRLLPGPNTLSLSSPDCGTLALALSWYPRRL